MRKITLALFLVLACSLPAQATFDFEFVAIEEQVQIGGQFAYIEFLCELTNLGDERDNFHINKTEILAGPVWSASIRVGGFCYAPFINDVDTGDVDPGASIEVRLDMAIGMEVGTSFATLTINSLGDPGIVHALDFTAIHEDCDLLLVDDAAKAENLWLDVPDAFEGKAVGVWPRRDAEPDLEDLQTFPMTFWLCGDTLPTLVESDRFLLELYLAAAGPLAISGQDIAYDLNDPGSANSDAGTIAWFEDVLGLDYRGDDGGLLVDGRSGDYLGEGLTFILDGNQTDPDIIGVVTGDPVSTSFVVSDGRDEPQILGVTRGGSVRMIYLGFGLEGTGDDMSTIASRCCDILAGPTAAEGAQAPASLELGSNYPNPFNPKTTLRFSAPAAGVAGIEVLDLRGRRVSEFSVMARVGTNEVPFLATDAAGHELPSGVYLYRITLGGETAGGKMTLLK